MARALVEQILNIDERLVADKTLHRVGPEKWATLRNDNLKIAHDKKLPVDTLLDSKEHLGKKPVHFVDLRNKVAHGDVRNLLKTLVDYDPNAEALAYKQVNKATRFLVAWFNSSPNIQKA